MLLRSHYLLCLDDLQQVRGGVPICGFGMGIVWKMDQARSDDVKKGKRGACRHKAATVLPDRTAAT